jgi:hypothetical protein
MHQQEFADVQTSPVLSPRENPILTDMVELRRRQQYYTALLPHLSGDQISNMVRAGARREWSFGIKNEHEHVLACTGQFVNYYPNEQVQQAAYKTDLSDFIEAVSK